MTKEEIRGLFRYLARYRHLDPEQAGSLRRRVLEILRKPEDDNVPKKQEARDPSNAAVVRQKFPKGRSTVSAADRCRALTDL